MTTAAFISFGLLGAWWFLLSAYLAWNYWSRLREKKTPLTAKDREDIRELEASLPRKLMRWWDYLFISPFILLMLPVYLYGWLVEDPYAKFDRLSTSNDARNDHVDA